MRVILLLLIVALIGLNVWVLNSAHMGAARVEELQAAITAQQVENAALLERNRTLEAEVVNLKEGYEAIEERARTDFGLIREDETFFQLLEKPLPGPIPKKQ